MMEGKSTRKCEECLALTLPGLLMALSIAGLAVILSACSNTLEALERQPIEVMVGIEEVGIAILKDLWSWISFFLPF
jgi:hypothetical protein